MKTLLVLRHGKSSWEDTGSDHDRVLRPRGRRAARTMGRFLARAGLEPGHALVSSATRAHDTFEEARSAGGWDCPTEVLASLYLAGVDAVLDALRNVPDDVDRVLYVGHQPTCGELLRDLAGARGVQYATGTLARIDIAAPSWSGVEDAFGEVVFVLPPRVFRSGFFDFVEPETPPSERTGER